jgi:LysR family transcriptional regulator, regulator for bpeEF and oprC
MDRLSAMRLFVRIGQLGSFTQGAASLRISSATATERIRRLESELKTKLLNRSTRKVTLTEEGERYFKICQSVLDELEEVEQAIGEANQLLRGSVTMSVNVGIFRAMLLPSIASFANDHPELRLQIMVTDQRADFVRDNVDFAVRIGGLEDQDLIVRPLGTPMRVTVASPKYIRRYGTPRSPEEIRQHKTVEFLLPQAVKTLAWEYASRGKKSELHFGGPIALNDAEGRVKLAEGGFGVAQTVCFLAAEGIARGRLVRLLKDWETPAPAISILYSRNRHLPARVRLVMDFTASLIVERLKAARRIMEQGAR